ncbi:hypothetical protein TWF281_000431 [Arthrobotrys megalospora]
MTATVKKRKRDSDDEGDESDTPSSPTQRGAATRASSTSDGTSASETGSDSETGSETGSDDSSGSESGSGDDRSASGDSDSDDSGSTDDSTSSSSSSDDSSSSGEEAWDGQSDDNEETTGPSPNRCIFCGGEEDEDPSETYEESLECKICNNTAHRQCARNHKGPGQLAADGEDAISNWRCSTCAGLTFEDDAADVGEERTTPRLKLKVTTSQNRSPGGKATPNVSVAQNNDNTTRRLRTRHSDEFKTPSESRPQRQIKRTNYLQLQTALDGTSAEPEHDSSTPIRISSRQRRTRFPEGSSRGASVQKSNQGVILKLKFKPEKLAYAIATSSSILAQFPKKGQKSSSQPWMTPGHNPFQPQPQVQYSHYTLAHYESVTDENVKPYGGILNETETDTSKTLPLAADKIKFDKARQEADEEKAQREAMLAAAMPTPKPNRKHDQAQRASSHASMIKSVHFGNHQIDTWYAAPYPEEYSRNRILYLCEFCLKYMNSEFVQWRHRLKCPHKHPPGDEIYRDGTVSIFEVDGRKQPAYCQNLCLLAKLFLGSKTLYYDVDQFLFYVMAEYNETGSHFVGYFSKEKRSTSSNNVSCILTLPIHQRKGYGHLLIDFSYLLTRTEGRLGSPEKPLSDLGLVSYRNYWKLTLCYLLRDFTGATSVQAMCDQTGMTADDVISALENLQVLIRDPITKTYAFRIDRELMQTIIDKWESKGYVKLNPRALVWVPFVMGRQSLLQAAPPTIAPREDEPVLEEGVLVDETVASTPAATSVNTPKDSIMDHEDSASSGKSGDPMDLDSGMPQKSAANQKKARSPATATKLTPPEEPPTVRKGNTSFIRLGDDPFRRAASTPAKDLPTRVAVDPNYIPPSRFQLVSNTPGSGLKKPKFNRSPSAASSNSKTSQPSRVVSAPPVAARAQSVSDLKTPSSSRKSQPQPTPQQQIRKARSSLFEEAREPHNMTIIRQSSRKSTRVSLAPRGLVPSPAPSKDGQITVITNGGGGYDSTDQMSDSVKSVKSELPGAKP